MFLESLINSFNYSFFMSNLIRKLVTNHVFVFIFLSLVVILFKLPSLNLPFHWDSFVDIAETAFALINNTHNLSGYYFRHPPFPFLVLTLCFKIFGTSYIVANILMMLTNITALFYIYKIGKYIYNEYVGILAALSSFFIPIFFSQSILVNNINFIRPLFFMAIYYTLTRDIKKYLIFASLLLLSRETEIFTIVCTSFIWIWREKKIKWQLSIPFLLLILWAICNKLLFGWFLYPTYVSFFSFSIDSIFLFRSYFYELFISQNRFILTLGYLLSSMFLKKKLSSREANFEALSLIIIFSYLLFYSFTPNFLPRYFVSLYPLLIILTYGKIQKVLSVKFCIVFFIIINTLFIIGWHGERTIPPGWQLETNMEYADVVRTHMAAAKFIEKNYANQTVLTCWPMTLELSNPFNGYVNKKIKVQDYLTNKSTSNIQVIYFSQQSNCYKLLNEVDLSNFILVKEFLQTGKITRVYYKK